MNGTHLGFCDLWVDDVGRYIGRNFLMECCVEVGNVLRVFKLVYGGFDD